MRGQYVENGSGPDKEIPFNPALTRTQRAVPPQRECAARPNLFCTVLGLVWLSKIRVRVVSWTRGRR